MSSGQRKLTPTQRRAVRRPGNIHDASVPRRAAAPPPPPASDWRSEIAGISGLNVVAGIWLIIAPWVLGYSGRDPRWNDVVFGIVVGVLAFVRASGAYRAEGLSWLNAAVGVWLFVAAFTIDHTAVAAWNDIVLGILVFLLAVSSAEATANLIRHRRTPHSPGA